MRCDSTCWLRHYRQFTDPKTATNFEPYRPTLSQVYTPLAAHEIRILRVEPGIDNQPIETQLLPGQIAPGQGQIVTRRDNRVVEFKALSYSWGYGGDRTQIMCNGTPFEVLRSLYSALLIIRHRTEPVHIWIDAVCINQNDDNEKSNQITKIFQIYHRASAITVWLGEKHECGDEAISYLADSDGLDLEHGRECMVGLAMVNRGVEQLANRPWFERTWVRQEAFAAREMIVHVSDQSISWRQLRVNAQKAQKSLELLKKEAGNGAEVIPMNGIQILIARLTRLRRPNPSDVDSLDFRNQRAILMNESLSLEQSLRDSTNFKATNSRDFIYGLVSMTSVKAQTIADPTFVHSNHELNEALVDDADGKWNLSLRVDYNASVADVFVDAAEYIMRFHRSVEVILCAAQTHRLAAAYQADGDLPMQRLPSWCPDWRYLPKTNHLDSLWATIDSGWLKDDTGWLITRQAGNPLATVETRAVLGSRTCSGFSRSKSLREQLYLPAEAHVERGQGLFKLHCSGFFLGKIKSKGSHGSLRQSMHRMKLSMSGTKEKPKPKEGSFAFIMGDDPEGYVEYTFEPTTEIPRADIEYPPKRRNFDWLSEEYLRSSHRGVSHIVATLTGTVRTVPEAEDGDQVALLIGSSIPVLLRPAQGDVRGCHILIGYIHHVDYTYQECVRRIDAMQDGKRRSNNNPKHPPWPNLGPLKEDLERRQFVLI